MGEGMGTWERRWRGAKRRQKGRERRNAEPGRKEESSPLCMWLMRSFFRASPLMSESLSLKSLSPLPLHLFQTSFPFRPWLLHSLSPSLLAPKCRLEGPGGFHNPEEVLVKPYFAGRP